MIKSLFLSLLLSFSSCVLILSPVNAAAIELVPSSRVILKVTDDMTIDDIIEGVYPQDQELWPRIKQKLIETNSDSFVQDSDLLIPGTRLKLVDIKRAYEQPEPISRVGVGYVVGLSGKVSASNANGGIRQLQVNAQVFEGDRLETGMGSSLHVKMDDAAEVFLKENSVLKVSEYAITSGYDKKSSSVFDLLRGGLRKITGAIGADPAANYQLHTGVANIGIRGTEYVLKLCEQNDCSSSVSRNDPRAMLHAVVLAGSISLTSENKVQVLLAPGEYATATEEALVLENGKALPAGFLDAQEAQKFSLVSQQTEQEEESSNSWMWIVGILLLVVGL